MIDTVRTEEREVRDRAGHWYMLRIHPYRTSENKIDGAVVVFGDIDEAKHAQMLLQESGEYAQSIVDTVREPILILTEDLRVKSANQSFYRDLSGQARGDGEPVPLRPGVRTMEHSLTADTTGRYPPRPPHVRGVRGRARIPRDRAQGDAPQRPSGVPAGRRPATHPPGVSGRDRVPEGGGGVAAERGAIPHPDRIDAPDHLHRQAQRRRGLLQPALGRVHRPVLRCRSRT